MEDFGLSNGPSGGGVHERYSLFAAHQEDAMSRLYFARQAAE